MPRVRLWASTAALAVIVSVPRPADGIRCWGANAIALQREHGEVKSCTHGAEQFDLYRYEGDDVCFDKCGGVTWFEGFSTGGAPFANPDGKRLCPGVVDKGECNCEAWHEALTPNAKGNHGCPQCDDYAVLPPLIRTRNTPSARWSKWVKLEECPAEYDMCVDYCYREPAFMGAAKWCFFGCAQSAYVQAMGVAVASQLSHLDYRKQWNTGRMTIYSVRVRFRCAGLRFCLRPPVGTAGWVKVDVRVHTSVRSCFCMDAYLRRASIGLPPAQHDVLHAE